MTPAEGIRSAFRGRSQATPHRVLAAIAFVGGLISLGAAEFPPTPGAPVIALWSVGGSVLVASAVLWFMGDRIPMRALEIGTTCGIGFISVIVARSGTNFGAVVASSCYLWLAVYGGIFFPRRVARAQLALIGVGFGVAVLAGRHDLPFSAWLFLTASLVLTGEVVGRQSSQLRREARTDSLTGALNRKGLELASERIFSLSDRTGIPVTMLLIDLDDFKQVNDSEGHLAGDRLLSDLVRVWRAELEPADLLVRLGGDEFLIMLVGSTEDERNRLLERLRFASATPWSVGVVVRESDEALGSCLARADADLYQVKRSRGPNGKGASPGRLRALSQSWS